MQNAKYDAYNDLESCRLCPRNCGKNRLAGDLGTCKAGAGFEIASISVHTGEEPVISGKKGICNVFFSHCNMQCIFCQNYQISGKDCSIKTPERTLYEVVKNIKKILDTGIENLGFVSPSHMVPQMKTIIRALQEDGYFPYIVYNTNAYDKVETLKSLEEWVDVYLPDFKYSDPALSLKYSDSSNYPEIAGLAIKEMYRQKGNTIRLNENGIAESGLIIRHLVLPGAVENSLGVLRYIAEEISTRIYISLMSQYYPTPNVSGISPLNRKLIQSEYQQVVEELEKLGFTKGWVQDHESAGFYFPDFESEWPFGIGSEV
jgi:putative pyruvate formate lyase activating enzyme